ncbi:MAG: hypothetical protein EP307_01735 [Rhodobacteraceae bacterium]|nr:MAG: hypothetical protein EP307_01735 [Paracoccaceae bacterium]
MVDMPVRRAPRAPSRQAISAARGSRSWASPISGPANTGARPRFMPARKGPRGASTLCGGWARPSCGRAAARRSSRWTPRRRALPPPDLRPRCRWRFPATT